MSRSLSQQYVERSSAQRSHRRWLGRSRGRLAQGKDANSNPKMVMMLGCYRCEQSVAQDMTKRMAQIWREDVDVAAALGGGGGVKRMAKVNRLHVPKRTETARSDWRDEIRGSTNIAKPACSRAARNMHPTRLRCVLHVLQLLSKAVLRWLMNRKMPFVHSIKVSQ